jgi:hypothetical protein
MDLPKDVMPESSPEAETVVETVEEKVIETGNETAPITPDGGGKQEASTPVIPGGKTPHENLLAALHEAREENKRLKEQHFTNPSTPTEPEVFSDEGRTLNEKIKSLEQQLKTVADEKELERFQGQHPILRDKAADFQVFRNSHPGYKTEDVVKLFIVDQGISDAPARKGLEKRTSGTKVPTADGYTAEQVSDLRKNNHEKYLQLLQSGKIDFSDLK